MHTPTHAVVNLALLRGNGWQIAAGAVTPDLPAMAYQLSGRLLGRWPEWFRDGTTILHSLPLAAGVLVLSLWRRWPPAFALSLLLHIALDAPFHHGDALRHLWPLSDYRWKSPLSYWDPAHHAMAALLLSGRPIWTL